MLNPQRMDTSWNGSWFVKYWVTSLLNSSSNLKLSPEAFLCSTHDHHPAPMQSNTCMRQYACTGINLMDGNRTHEASRHALPAYNPGCRDQALAAMMGWKLRQSSLQRPSLQNCMHTDRLPCFLDGSVCRAGGEMATFFAPLAE